MPSGATDASLSAPPCCLRFPNDNENTGAVPSQERPLPFLESGGPRRLVPPKPARYKIIGPTSQHRPKVITVTMVVLRNPLMMKSFGCA